jgi:hypothetical protein
MPQRLFELSHATAYGLPIENALQLHSVFEPAII